MAIPSIGSSGLTARIESVIGASLPSSARVTLFMNGDF